MGDGETETIKKFKSRLKNFRGRNGKSCHLKNYLKFTWTSPIYLEKEMATQSSVLT